MTPCALALPALVSSSTPLRCWRLHATLPARDCATRCLARIPSGGGRGAVRFHPRGGCSDGARVAAELEAHGWTRPKDSLPAEVLPTPQRFARIRWCKTFAAQVEPGDERLDPLHVAARATPDDPGVEPDLSGLA